jgi:hypothetical protein
LFFMKNISPLNRLIFLSDVRNLIYAVSPEFFIFSNQCPKNLSLKTDLFIYMPPILLMRVRKRFLCWTVKVQL